MRGRPREECNDLQVERRRKNARLAQSRMRERRSHLMSDMQSRINLLEDIIERLGTSFNAFGAVLLESDVFNDYNYKNIANSFRDTLQTFYTLSKTAHLEKSESQQIAPLDDEKYNLESQQSRGSAAANNISPSQLNTTLETSRSNTTPTATLLPPSIIQFDLPRGLSDLSSDYWGDALLNDSNLPFWKFLHRSTLLESHLFLRQKQLDDFNNVKSSRMAYAHLYSFQITSIATMLRVNSMSLQAIAMGYEDNHGPNPEHKKGSDAPNASGIPYGQSDQDSNLDLIHNLGAQVRGKMASAGKNVEDFVNAQNVELYLLRKGMIHFNHRQLQMQVNLGESRNHSTVSTLTISTPGLVRRLMSESMCLGDGVGYPESRINSAIVASVVEII